MEPLLLLFVVFTRLPMLSVSSVVAAGISVVELPAPIGDDIVVVVVVAVAGAEPLSVTVAFVVVELFGKSRS